MKFKKEIIIDWYDNIIQSFRTDDNDITYYCCLLAINNLTNDKIYLNVDIAYLKGCDDLVQIINSNSFKEDWHKLHALISIKERNKSRLIKTKDLRSDINITQIINYKENYEWPDDVIWGEYPESLSEAEKIENWWALFDN